MFCDFHKSFAKMSNSAVSVTKGFGCFRPYQFWDPSLSLYPLKFSLALLTQLYSLSICSIGKNHFWAQWTLLLQPEFLVSYISPWKIELLPDIEPKLQVVHISEIMSHFSVRSAIQFFVQYVRQCSLPVIALQGSRGTEQV